MTPLPTRLPLCAGLAVLLALAAGLSACDLSTVQGETPSFLSFTGQLPDGRSLGFARDAIPFVDSTVTIRVFVGDTVNVRSGQGLPAGEGTARVAWSVSDGTVESALAEIDGFGIAEVRWRLGTDTLRQSITARLVGDGVAERTTTFEFAGILPGPPVALALTADAPGIREGATTTVRVGALRDRFGNAWDRALFDIALESSSPDVMTTSGLSSTGAATLNGVGPGEATLTATATGRLGQSPGAYDLSGLSVQGSVTVSVAAFDGFEARATQLSAGEAFGCLVAASGTEATAGAVYCWGRAADGRLGAPSLVESFLPAPRPALAVAGLPTAGTVRALDSGRAHTCAAVDDGEVYCWGANGSRQLGSFGSALGANRALLDNPAAASVAETGFRDVVAGAAHTCALGESGTVYCWGANDRGQLGSGTVGASQVLSKRVTGLDGVAVAALADLGPTANHTCAVASGGALYCWGAGTTGQLGDGSQLDRPRAARVSGGIAFERAATGGETTGSTCGVATSGALYCWGDPPTGARAVAVPGAVDGGDGAPYAAVSVGQTHACVLARSGGVSCLGSAADGRLGAGVVDAGVVVPAPQLVLGGGGYLQVRVGTDIGLGLLGGGAVRAWGGNRDGQLGAALEQTESAIPRAVVFETGG